MFAALDALFHDFSELGEHRVDVALTDAIEYRSELLFSFKHASLWVCLSQALFELWLPDSRL